MTLPHKVSKAGHNKLGLMAHPSIDEVFVLLTELYD